MTLRQNRKSSEVNVLDFAKWLKSTESYKGGDIRLIACSAGKYEDGAAQLLSDLLDVKVLAPIDDVLVYPDGTMIVDVPNVPREVLISDKFQKSCWKAFEPRKK